MKTTHALPYRASVSMQEIEKMMRPACHGLQTLCHQNPDMNYSPSMGRQLYTPPKVLSPRKLLGEDFVAAIFATGTAQIILGKLRAARACRAETDPDWDAAKADVLKMLKAIGELEEGWNGYTAPKPNVSSQQNARELIECAFHCHMMPLRVSPSGMGGVAVTFGGGNREVTVELYNNETAHALFADDDSDDMHTQPVATHVIGYRQLLDAARRYIHAQAEEVHRPSFS